MLFDLYHRWMPPLVVRFEWIDFLRGLAVVGMIWTHVTNTLLPAAVQATPFYRDLSYYHGLVAPTFFWLAGYMRGVSAARPGPLRPAWHTVKRLLIIWGIGYFLHLPWEALGPDGLTPQLQRYLWQSDVLHCLAVSCLLLLAVERLTHGRLWLTVSVIAALGATVVLVTDAMTGVATGFMPLDGYLSKSFGSLFPLFPWLGFACAGFVSGCHGSPGWRTLGLGVVLALIIPHIPGSSGTVQFFLERTGWVMMFAALLVKAGAWVHHAPRWLMLAGRESLALYVAHVILIYAVPWSGGKALSVSPGPTQTWPRIWMWFVLILGASLLIAWLNERRKRWSKAS